MSIQGNVNQILSNVGYLTALSPKVKANAEKRALAESTEARRVGAESGLRDILSNFERIERGEKKAYSKTQLRDIAKRVGEHNKTIQDIKTLSLNPEYAPHLGKTIGHDELTNMLTKIEGYIGKIEEPSDSENLGREMGEARESRAFRTSMERAAQQAEEKMKQLQSRDEIRKMLLKGTSYENLYDGGGY